MAIRIPIKVFDYNNTTIQGGGPTSVAGGVAKQFFLPQDTDNVVVKFTASVMGGGVSATFQTTDDGGSTWYDVQRTSIISYGGNSVLGGGQDNAQWLSIPVISAGARTTVLTTSVVAVGSVQTVGSVGGTIGQTGASTLGQGAVSGLPIMSTNARIFLQYTAAVSSIISERVTVLANSQSATA